jgi:hypothetical protein
MKILFILYFGTISFWGFGQPSNCTKFHQIQNCINYDSIGQQYPYISGISEQYKTALFNALYYFPKLKGSDISFKEVKINTTLNTRPKLGSLIFRTRAHRKYIIRINNSVRDSAITLQEVPFDALVGVFGHELCHIADYTDRNLWGIFLRAYAYLHKKEKGKFEKEIDYLTIKQGLGCPLYQWAYFVLYQSEASCKYKQFKRDIYMEPEEIDYVIKTLTVH